MATFPTVIRQLASDAPRLIATLVCFICNQRVQIQVGIYKVATRAKKQAGGVDIKL